MYVLCYSKNMDKFTKKSFEENKITEKTSFKQPPEMKVVLYNDDFTTMDFVIDVLISVFNKSKKDADNLTADAHNNGSSVIGVYAYDIAVSLCELAKTVANKNGFPLRVEVE